MHTHTYTQSVFSHVLDDDLFEAAVVEGAAVGAADEEVAARELPLKAVVFAVAFTMLGNVPSFPMGAEAFFLFDGGAVLLGLPVGADDGMPASTLLPSPPAPSPPTARAI